MNFKKKAFIVSFSFGLFLFLVIIIIGIRKDEIFDNNISVKNNDSFYIDLPKPTLKGEISVEEAIFKRRSIRNYKDTSLTLEEVSQLLWSAQGFTSFEPERRVSPSAGALYPLEVYLVVENVEGIEKGVYRYLPKTHKIVNVVKGSVSKLLAESAFGQSFISKAPVSMVFSGVFSRTTIKYGERGVLYVYMEAGHAAQNVYLQSESLKLGIVVVAAFNEREIKEILNMPKEETPLYIIPVGRKKE